MQYGLTIATEPAKEPVTLQEVRDYCRQDISDDDTMLARQITAARKFAEQRCRRAFITTTFDLWLPAWPRCEIVLPSPPAQSVSFVKYLDTSDVYQTVASTVYTLDETENPARVVLAYGQSWPSVIERRKAINVRYVAGYGDDPEDVPAGIREAICALVYSVYEERGVFNVGNIVNRFPFGAEALLDPFRVVDFALSQGGEW